MRFCSKVTPSYLSLSLSVLARQTDPPPPSLPSQTCQTSAWPSHKAECRGLSSLRAAYSKAKALSGGPKVKGEWIPHEGVRALARLSVERRRRRENNGGKDDLWVSSPSSFSLTLPPCLLALLLPLSSWTLPSLLQQRRLTHLAAIYRALNL